MQRYRVNYRLLIGLIVGVVVAAPAAYGLWWFQVDRNADRLLARAQAAEERGEDLEAYEAYFQYIKLRDEDDEARIKLARAAVKVAESLDVNLDQRKRSEAYGAVVEAVHRTGDRQLRRDLVELHVFYQLPDRALQTIAEIEGSLEGGAQLDPELMAIKARCLFGTQDLAKGAQYCYKLIGYNADTDSFDDSAALATDQPPVYSMLAQYLLMNDQADLAERVIEQMAEKNPESRQAYMIQYELLQRMDKADEARAALEKAYELEPTDPGVLLAKGIAEFNDHVADNANAENPPADSDVEPEQYRKQAEEHLDAATKFFTEGMRLYPDHLDFYNMAARVQQIRKRYEEALATIDAGLKRFDLRTHENAAGVPMALELMSQKIEILLTQKNVEAVRREIRALRALDSPQLEPLADYFGAHIELANENWLQAARMFKDVRNRLISYPRLQALAATHQGICHTRLGQPDLALEAFNFALGKNPELAVAIAGRDEALGRLGRTGDGAASVAQYQELVEQQLKLPEAQQNWQRVEEQIDEYISRQAEQRNMSDTWIESRRQLLRAEMWISRGRAQQDERRKKDLFKMARDAITAASKLDPDDLQVQLAALQLLLYEPDSGPEAALSLLDKVIAKRGDSLALRLIRVEILFALRGEQIASQLRAATEGMEDWPADNQAQVWAAVATRFERLGQLQDASLCMAKAAELAPSLLQYRVAQFELALKAGDDEGMQAAQKKILSIVGSEEAPEYIVTAVKRMIVRYDKGEVDLKGLGEARRLLSLAIRNRPTWADLYVLSGQLAMVLEKNPKLALESFEKAMETGPLNLTALSLQIRQLADLRRFAEARQKMDLVSQAVWTPLLDRVAAIVLQNVGETQKAYEEGKKFAEANANNPAAQLWFADLAYAAEKYDEAEAALRKTVDLNSNDPDAWMSLVNFYSRQRRAAEIQATLRQAELALEEEFLPLLMADQYRIFGYLQDAERLLLAAYAERTDELPVAQRLAQFYLTWSDQVAAREAERGVPPTAAGRIAGKAAVHINRILRAANEDKTRQNDPAVAWARRQAARRLSLTGDYQDSLKAEKLLAQAVADNVATPEGEELLVELLIRRDDPASLERVVELLKKIQRDRGLPPALALQLGKALAAISQWDDCQRHMEDSIGRHPDDLPLRVGYIELLIARKDTRAAATWLTRLGSVKGAERVIPTLQVQLAAAEGDKAKLRKMLQAMTPDLRRLNEAQLKVVQAVSQLAQAVGDHEYALTLLNQLASREPQRKFELARSTAMYGDIDQGLTMLRQMFTDNMDAVLGVAIDAYRTRRSQAPEKFDPVVEMFVSAARRNDPDSAQRMVLEAESLEIRGDFEAAIAAYSNVLKRDDAPRLVRATALNNLAFLLAMKNQDLDRALQCAQEAIDIVGPLSDILDTRALVRYHRREFDQAVVDLRTAVKKDATASKYFHLAMALLASGDELGALEAWKEAEARNIAIESTPALEQQSLEETMRKIETLRGGAPGA